MTERRRFIATASGAIAAVAAAAIVDAPNVIAQPKVQWRMSTAWTPALDHLQGVAQRLAKVVEETSGGRFRIEVFPGGQIMQPFECFAAASQSKIEIFMASSYYWNDKERMPPGHVPEPAVEWFCTVPFGMNAEGMAAWYYQGDGLKLWEETYAAFNLVPRPATAAAPQMAGWFRKKINTIGDYKGLKMRIGTGQGGKVYAKAGGTAVLTPGAEIYAAFERGVIDAAEWVGPHDDMKLRLHNTARDHYYPGWHEPGTTTEFGFNKRAYESLPADLKAVVDRACQATQVHTLMEYEYKNTVALQKLKTEFKGKVEILQLSQPTLKELKKLADTVLKEESEKSPQGKKAFASVKKFEATLNDWRLISEAAYHAQVAAA